MEWIIGVIIALVIIFAFSICLIAGVFNKVFYGNIDKEWAAFQHRLNGDDPYRNNR